MQYWACLNGVLMPAEEARVSVFDSGFMQGIGLFETMRAYSGRVFRLDRHLDRLINSANALRWMVVPDTEELADNVQQVVGALGGADARVRLTVTTGSLHPAAEDQPELTIVVSAAEGGRYPEEHYRQGVTAVVSEYRQSDCDPTAGHKTTSYFARLVSLGAAYAEGALEALWLTHDNFVAEGAISSVFAVRDGALWTPPLETPVLPGITRAVVLELAARVGRGRAGGTAHAEGAVERGRGVPDQQHDGTDAGGAHWA